MSTRVYLPLADVATACGVSQYRLLNEVWPAHWAVPRDWRMLPRSSTVLVAEAALPELVVALRLGGEAMAAARLDRWCAEIETPESHEDFVSRHSAPSAAPDQAWYRKGQFA